jgi:hypothetical protein
MYVMPNSTVFDTTRESAQSDFSHSLQDLSNTRPATLHQGLARCISPLHENPCRSPIRSPTLKPGSFAPLARASVPRTRDPSQHRPAATGPAGLRTRRRRRAAAMAGSGICTKPLATPIRARRSCCTSGERTTGRRRRASSPFVDPCSPSQV